MTRSNFDKRDLAKAWNLNKAHGFYEPFQTLGVMLSLDSALSTWLARAIREYRLSKSESLKQASFGYLNQREQNLEEACKLIDRIIADYDRNGMWDELFDLRRRFSSSDMCEVLLPDFGLHGFPIVVESARWNADYMLKHSVREFYVYTRGYLERVNQNVRESRDRFNVEVVSAKVESAWLELMDLNGIEVADHCDVCRKVISLLLRLRDMTRAGEFAA